MVGLDEAEREDGPDGGPDVEGAPEGGASSDAGADAPSADFAAAALSLIDPMSLAGGDEVRPEPLQYREGDGVRSVMAASQLPVLAPSEGYGLWATVSLEGASAGDELLAPDSAGDEGGFIVTRSGEHSITLTASDSLLFENSPAEVEELLRNTVALVGYANSVQDPLEGPRTIHVTLGNNSHEASVSRFVFVTSVNDAPTLVAGGDTNLVFTEPADPTVRAPIALFQPGAVAINDVDSEVIGRASVRIVDAPASVDDPLGTLDRLLVDLPADGSITSRLEFKPSLYGTMGELRLTLEGTASAEIYSRLLETVRFDSLDIDPQQESRSVRISVVDVDDDGVPEEAVSPSIERRVDVKATNTMPIVNLIDASFSEAVHRLTPVALLPEFQLRDPDSGNQLARVVLVLDNPGRLMSDSFNVYLQGNSLFSVGRATDGTRDTYTVLPKTASGVASVTEFQSFLKTWTYANTSRANVDHDVGITIKAYDPQGAEGTATSRLVIVAHPDAPQSEGLPRLDTPDALTVAEDGQLPLPASLFPFRDPDGDLLAGVSITTLPNYGSLVMSGRVVQ
ncbi:MAG: hypothetical protein RBT67_16445, partial [Thauera sp.]|nr:hypothetical protein [Thauera sp.]